MEGYEARGLDRAVWRVKPDKQEVAFLKKSSAKDFL